MRHLLRILSCCGFLFGAVVFSPGRMFAQALSADQIVVRMMERNALRQAMLQHYASDRIYHLEYHGTAGKHDAEMKVHAEYTAPGRKRLTVISESGSKVLCAEVLRRLVDGEQDTAAHQDWQRAMFSPATYNLRLLGFEPIDGVNAWVLAVEPKVATKVAYRGKVWISTEDFATVRVLAEPAKSPSWMLNHASFDARYMRRGAIWVPSRNVSMTHVRIGGEATVTIDYGLYETLAALPEGVALAGMGQSGTMLPPSLAANVGKKAMVGALR